MSSQQGSQEEPKTDAQLARELLDALDEALKEGLWEQGVLFQTIGKKLRLLRDRIKKDLCHEKISTTAPSSKRPNQFFEQSKLIPVYVSLYMVNGNNIQQWEKLLRTLASRTLTRPIYKQEEDVRKALRTKTMKVNDAYTKVYIDPQNILPPSDNNPLRDRHGYELLTLRPRAIKTSNIIEFMHKSGLYLFQKGKLLRQKDQSFLDFV